MSFSNNSNDSRPHKPTVKCVESTKTLHSRIFELLEKDLDKYEQISILFLISADDSDAYRNIYALFQDLRDISNVFGAFVRNNFDRCSEKLLEALCIINNYEILRNLGFESRHIIQKYLCNISCYACNIHPVSKVLYKLFDALNPHNSKLLLNHIYKDGTIKRQFQDEDYLELHALHWIDAKFITILPGGKGNLSNISKHLKKLEHCDKIIYQDVQHFSEPTELRDLRPLENESSPDNSLVAIENGVSSRVAIEYLPQKHIIKKGKCIIINEENFLTDAQNQYEKREGSRKDGENVRRTFTGMGFDVEVHDDLTQNEMMDELERVSRTFDKKMYDCLVVVILSHGYPGGIVSTDGKEIPITTVEDAVCNTNLGEVVKILIIQACQGKVMGNVSSNSGLALDGPSGISTYKSESILGRRNFARFMSTMNGFSAIRHKEEGSWFIQAICEVLSNGRSLSVSQWQMKVIEKVQTNVGCVNQYKSVSQIPEFSTRLGCEVYFPAYKKSSLPPLRESVAKLLQNYV